MKRPCLTDGERGPFPVLCVVIVHPPTPCYHENIGIKGPEAVADFPATLLGWPSVSSAHGCDAESNKNHKGQLNEFLVDNSLGRQVGTKKFVPSVAIQTLV